MTVSIYDANGWLDVIVIEARATPRMEPRAVVDLQRRSLTEQLRGMSSYPKRRIRSLRTEHRRRLAIVVSPSRSERRT